MTEQNWLAEQFKGAVGAAWVAGRQPRVVFVFAIEESRIISIDLLADPERLQQSNLKLLAN